MGPAGISEIRQDTKVKLEDRVTAGSPTLVLDVGCYAPSVLRHQARLYNL